MSKSPIQVLVIDDHQLIINGLKSIFQDEKNVAFAGGANNMDEAMTFLKQTPVDVVVTDISIPVSRVLKLPGKSNNFIPIYKFSP